MSLLTMFFGDHRVSFALSFDRRVCFRYDSGAYLKLMNSSYFDPFLTIYNLGRSLSVLQEPGVDPECGVKRSYTRPDWPKTPTQVLFDNERGRVCFFTSRDSTILDFA